MKSVTGGSPNDVNIATAKLGSGGAFYLLATLGSISFTAISTDFTACTSTDSGGAFYLLAT